MSIAHKCGEASWELTVPCGDYNYDFELEITEKGIEVAGDLITWEAIDEARSRFVKLIE